MWSGALCVLRAGPAPPAQARPGVVPAGGMCAAGVRRLRGGHRRWWPGQPQRVAVARAGRASRSPEEDGQGEGGEHADRPGAGDGDGEAHRRHHACQSWSSSSGSPPSAQVTLMADRMACQMRLRCLTVLSSGGARRPAAAWWMGGRRASVGARRPDANGQTAARTRDRRVPGANRGSCLSFSANIGHIVTPVNYGLGVFQIP